MSRNPRDRSLFTNKIILVRILESLLTAILYFELNWNCFFVKNLIKYLLKYFYSFLYWFEVKSKRRAVSQSVSHFNRVGHTVFGLRVQYHRTQEFQCIWSFDEQKIGHGTGHAILLWILHTLELARGQINIDNYQL